jgi:hypothetical protein
MVLIMYVKCKSLNLTLINLVQLWLEETHGCCLTENQIVIISSAAVGGKHNVSNSKHNIVFLDPGASMYTLCISVLNGTLL